MSELENADKRRPDDAGLDGAEKPGGAGSRPGQRRKHGEECTEWGWWEDRSLPQKILVGTGLGILGIGFLFLCGWVVMLLWNWLMPDIFGLKPLTYWQAWGLLILSHILFKGFGSGHGGGRSDRKRKRHLRRYMREDEAAAEGAHEGE